MVAGYLPGSDTTVRPTTFSSWSSDPENPLPRATAAEQPHKEKSSCCEAGNKAARWTVIGIGAVLMCAFAGGMIAWAIRTDANMPDTRYSVAIDSFSGLLDSNRTTDLTLDHPQFNLTLRVASFSRRADACVEPGTYLEVAYRCVTLAATATAQQQLCVGPGEAAEQKLVASGTQVRVPGDVLDSLAADMRQGAPVFQVTIRWSGGQYADDALVASCGGRRVGAAAAADLGTICDAWHLCYWHED